MLLLHGLNAVHISDRWPCRHAIAATDVNAALLRTPPPTHLKKPPPSSDSASLDALSRPTTSLMLGADRRSMGLYLAGSYSVVLMLWSSRQRQWQRPRG